MPASHPGRTGASQWALQRGAGGGLIMAAAVVLVMVGLVAAWQVAWLASGARARSVSDLVALSAARAQQLAEPACTVAEDTARQNHARLLDCQVITGWGEFVVDVTVEVDVVPRISGAPQVARAASRAGVVAEP